MPSEAGLGWEHPRIVDQGELIPSGNFKRKIPKATISPKETH
jgi:hypothetical protein